MPVQLSDSELLTLVTLGRYVMRADGRVTDAEIRKMMDMAREVGLRAFSDALEATRDGPPMDRMELVRLAETVKADDVRRFMYDLLVGVAESDEMAPSEQALLEILADVWCLGD